MRDRLTQRCDHGVGASAAKTRVPNLGRTESHIKSTDSLSVGSEHSARMQGPELETELQSCFIPS